MDSIIIIKEVQLKAIKSSGPGGQHVNKVSSKIELQFNINTSLGLTNIEKELIIKRLSHRISKKNVLVLTSQETRSQFKNKELVIKRFFSLLKEATTREKLRKATRPTKSSLQRKSEQKRKQSQKKQLRCKPNID